MRDSLSVVRQNSHSWWDPACRAALRFSHPLVRSFELSLLLFAHRRSSTPDLAKRHIKQNTPTANRWGVSLDAFNASVER